MSPKVKSRARGKAAGSVPVRIANSVSSFMRHVQNAARAGGFYAFRGQENSAWGVESAASRRLRKLRDNPPTFEEFARYHRETLIDPAKLRGYHRQGDRMWTDLELLANLQHHRAATGLIDFTRNPLVALWFACHKSPETSGGVFMVNLSDSSQYESVAVDAIEGDVDGLFQRFQVRRLQFWDLEEINPRIAHQAGIFIFGRPSVPPDAIVRKMEIPSGSKRRILADLEKAHNISARHLFGDLHGFARLNRADSSIGKD